MYLNRHYSDPFKPAKVVNLVRRGPSKFKNPLCCRLHLTRMVRAKRKMEMEMEALLPGT